MNTERQIPTLSALAMAAMYQRLDVPAVQVAQEYLGLSESEAKRRATTGALPWPVWRAGGQKSPWLIRVEDLAAWRDRECGS